MNTLELVSLALWAAALLNGLVVLWLARRGTISGRTTRLSAAGVLATLAVSEALDRALTGAARVALVVVCALTCVILLYFAYREHRRMQRARATAARIRQLGGQS